MMHQFFFDTILLRTDSSILMSGGQGRLKPSPRNFIVASMPSLSPKISRFIAVRILPGAPIDEEEDRPAATDSLSVAIHSTAPTFKR